MIEPIKTMRNDENATINMDLYTAVEILSFRQNLPNFVIMGSSSLSPIRKNFNLFRSTCQYNDISFIKKLYIVL